MGITTDNDTELKYSIMEKFRKQLLVLRAMAKISQETIAKKLNISRQTYSGIESGKREMTWTTFLSLLLFL